MCGERNEKNANSQEGSPWHKYSAKTKLMLS